MSAVRRAIEQIDLALSTGNVPAPDALRAIRDALVDVEQMAAAACYGVLLHEWSKDLERHGVKDACERGSDRFVEPEIDS